MKHKRMTETNCGNQLAATMRSISNEWINIREERWRAATKKKNTHKDMFVFGLRGIAYKVNIGGLHL